MVEQAASRERRRGCAGQGVYLLGLMYAVIAFLTGFGPFANDWTELVAARPIASFHAGRANCTVADTGRVQAVVRLPVSDADTRYEVTFTELAGSDSAQPAAWGPQTIEVEVPARARRIASAIISPPPSGDRRLVLIEVFSLPRDGFVPLFLSGCVLPLRGPADYAFAYLLPLTALIPLLGGAYLSYGGFSRPWRPLHVLTLVVMLLGYGVLTAVFLPRLLVPLAIVVSALAAVGVWWWRRGQSARP